MSIPGASVTRTTLFRDNKTRAVRLPHDVVSTDGAREVAILRDGACRVLVPADTVWDDVSDAPGIEMPERDQPVQVREASRSYVARTRWPAHPDGPWRKLSHLQRVRAYRMPPNPA